MLVVVLMIAACSDPVTSTSSVADTTSPDTSSSSDSMETFEAPELGFSIDYPSGWTPRLDTENSILEVTAPVATDGFLPNFNVSVGQLPADLPAVAYFEGDIPKLEATLPEVEVLEVVNLTVEGAPARGITITSTENNSTIGISRLIILGENNTAYELTFFAAAESLERLTTVVQDIFSSFHFIPGSDQ